ncbi:unnamed protein product [Camellia sinensis]
MGLKHQKKWKSDPNYTKSWYDRGAKICQVVEGKELLNPRTDKEKEKLKRNPKNWRLACQTTVGKPDSRGCDPTTA